jgi:AcrR family transcriptional regulator
MSPRGPYAKSRQRKDAIAAASLELVVERGHENVSIADVARRAGVAESSLLYHFPTRDELLVATLAAANATDRSGGEFDRQAASDPVGALHAVVRRGVSEPNRLRLYTEMLARASDPKHPAHRYIAEHHQDALVRATGLLRLRQEGGHAHPDVDPARFAREMVAIWEGLQAQWLVSSDFDLEEAVGEAFRRLSREDIMEAKRTMQKVLAGL